MLIAGEGVSHLSSSDMGFYSTVANGKTSRVFLYALLSMYYSNFFSNLIL